MVAHCYSSLVGFSLSHCLHDLYVTAVHLPALWQSILSAKPFEDAIYHWLSYERANCSNRRFLLTASNFDMEVPVQFSVLCRVEDTGCTDEFLHLVEQLGQNGKVFTAASLSGQKGAFTFYPTANFKQPYQVSCFLSGG